MERKAFCASFLGMVSQCSVVIAAVLTSSLTLYSAMVTMPARFAIASTLVCTVRRRFDDIVGNGAGVYSSRAFLPS